VDAIVAARMGVCRFLFCSGYSVWIDMDIACTQYPIRINKSDNIKYYDCVVNLYYYTGNSYRRAFDS